MRDLRELLTVGRLVIFSNGSKGIVVPHRWKKEAKEELAIAYKSKEYDYITRWDKELYDIGHCACTKHISKIYEVGNAYDFWREAVWDENERSLVWDRNLQANKTKVMTLSEVEKALGHKVKIILDHPIPKSTCASQAHTEGNITHYYDWEREYKMDFKPLPKAEPNPPHLIGEDEEEDYPFGAQSYNKETPWLKLDKAKVTTVTTKTDGTVITKNEHSTPVWSYNNNCFDF